MASGRRSSVIPSVVAHAMSTCTCAKRIAWRYIDMAWGLLPVLELENDVSPLLPTY